MLAKHDTEITAAMAALNAARRLKDALSVALCEAALNDLLDRYHTYHGSQKGK